jgi:hypothetical protein
MWRRFAPRCTSTPEPPAPAETPQQVIYQTFQSAPQAQQQTVVVQQQPAPQVVYQ